MNSDYNDNKTKKSPNLLSSFYYAFHGIKHAIIQERNMKLHIGITALVLILGWVFRLEAIEWLFLLFAIAGVITLELINSAIERVVDLASPDYHPLAKQAKDMAAGAVLVYAFLAVIVGLIIFLPKLFP